MQNLILQSTITCPQCGHTKQEMMPLDACQWFCECESCHSLAQPQQGDCCVFCCYGTVKFPPVQQQRPCCG